MLIQSLTNQKIKHLVNLQQKSYRQEHQEFIAQGFKTFHTLLETEYKLDSAYVTTTAHEQYQEQLPADRTFIVSEAIMKKISTTTTPSGLVAIFEIPEYAPKVTSSAIVLHNIQDPGNLGTLIRTAAAMAVECVFTIQGADAYQPKVIQATAGTIGYLKVIEITWTDFYNLYKNESLCALVVNKGKQPEDLDLNKSILIIGNEGQGLPEEIIKSCHDKLTIAMPGKTESLNAAVAGSIAMYLKTRKGL